MHLTLISKLLCFFCWNQRKHIRHVKWESSDRWYSIGSQIISVRITQPCVDPSNWCASLLSEARVQFWGHGPQSLWDKEQTMCARLTQEHTLTRWLTHSVTHCRPPAHTQLHTSARRVGTWAWEKKQLFLCACGRGNFRFGVFPVENMLHFLLTITVDDGWSLGNRLIWLNIDQHLDIVVINI